MLEQLRDRPTLTRLVLFNLPWVIGFALLAYVMDNDRRQDDRDAAQVARSGDENDCQTAWAVALTDALQDRDAVAAIARDAIKSWVRSDDTTWSIFGELLVSERPGDVKLQEMLAAIKDHGDDTAAYLLTLRRVGHTADINPYPDLTGCFDQLDDDVAAELMIRLVASHSPRGKCFGKHPTIRGTSRGDVLHGTDGRDVIASYGGIDLVVAGDGKDRICTGKHGDVISGGRGYDRVNCGRGFDAANSSEHKLRCELGRDQRR